MKYLNIRINIEQLSRICRQCNAWLLPFRPLRCIVLFYLVFLYNVIPSQAGIPTTSNLPAASIPPAPLPRTAIALSVVFENKSDTILPKYYAELDKFGEALEGLAGYIQIEGHTDSRGSQQDNQILSEKRANNVKNYLTEHFCIDPRRLIVKGYGSSRPRAINTTPEGRRNNNRIEVALPENNESSVTKIPIAERYVFFQSNSDKILQTSQTDLDSLGKELTASQYCAYRIQIDGHTDDTEPGNRSLSEKRAESIKQYFIDHFSIVPERLMVKGYGDSVPRFSNATSSCRDKNRRVEIVKRGRIEDIPTLIKALQTPESAVCLEVVDALGRALPVSDLKERQDILEALTTNAPQATRAVLTRLLQNVEPSHRPVIAKALANIAAETAIFILTDRLRTSDWNGQRDIAQDLAGIAEGLQENRRIDPRPLVHNILEALQGIETQYIGQIKQQVIHVQDTIASGHLLNKLQRWIGRHKVTLIGVIIYIVGLPSFWLLCLGLKPSLLIWL